MPIQDRAPRGGATAPVASPFGTVPAYLWVADFGNMVTAYGSSDGYVWAPIPGSAVSLDLGSSPLAGLAVTSAGSAALSTATMDGVVVSAAKPAPQPPVPCPAPW